MAITWVTINVSEYEASKAFYGGYLGLAAAREFSPGPGMSIAFFADEKGMEIELIAEAGAQLPQAANAGMSIGIRRANYDALLAEARARGLLIGEPAMFGPNVECFFVRDPNGVGVQVIREK